MWWSGTNLLECSSGMKTLTNIISFFLFLFSTSRIPSWPSADWHHFWLSVYRASIIHPALAFSGGLTLPKPLALALHTSLVSSLPATQSRYRAFHPQTAEFMFFSRARETFSKIDHMTGHKISLIKFIKIEIIPSIFLKQWYETRNWLKGKNWK